MPGKSRTVWLGWYAGEFYSEKKGLLVDEIGFQQEGPLSRTDNT